MEKATIYEVTCSKAYLIDETGTRWALRPWGENTEAYEGWDNGGCEYLLPDGFSFGKDRMGVPHVYDHDGYPMPIVGKDSPTLIEPSTGRHFALEKA